MMTPRLVPRVPVVAVLTLLLLGLAAPGGAHRPDPAGDLPLCQVPAAGPVPAGGWGRLAEWAAAAPTRLPAADPAACRAGPGRIEPTGAGQLPVPRPGYHHLGATTGGDWSGILGRISVRDPGVRARSFDFVATRFLAKRLTADGQVGWLEVGWAETGWSGGGSQRIYTFDSAAMSWVFHDGYAVGDGDQVWVYLHGEPDGTWQAWLWWGWQWHLLATTAEPLGERAQVEQYVEVFVDRRAGRRPFPVPAIEVDQVRLQDGPAGPMTGWRAGAVPTGTLGTSGSYCLVWQQRYDHWTAGDCAD